MTENDMDLLIRFKVAKNYYDSAEPLQQIEAARTLGESLSNLQYLDDERLRDTARQARMDFGDLPNWPPSVHLVDVLKESEAILIEAIDAVFPKGLLNN
jgi:hypothetical protein